MEPVLLAKSFKYRGHVGSHGAVFTGRLYFDEEALYLIHVKHSWESQQQAYAVLGVIGLLIDHLRTRKKPVSHPFPSTTIDTLPLAVHDKIDLRGIKPTATLSVVPKSEITGYRSSWLKGMAFTVGTIEIVPVSPKGKARKKLAEYGYLLMADEAKDPGKVAGPTER